MAQWRCFVLDSQVLDVRPYTGDYHAQFDPSIIDKAISCWKDAPIAYWLSALNYINFLKRRWKEMVKPYFEKMMFLTFLKVNL